jgi:hypothetical protein
MDAFLERLINEEKELGEKITGLTKALHSDGFSQKVGDYQYSFLFYLSHQYSLLSLQHSTMIAYRQVLIMRIADLTAKS